VRVWRGQEPCRLWRRSPVFPTGNTFNSRERKSEECCSEFGIQNSTEFSSNPPLFSLYECEQWELGSTWSLDLFLLLYSIDILHTVYQYQDEYVACAFGSKYIYYVPLFWRYSFGGLEMSGVRVRVETFVGPCPCPCPWGWGMGWGRTQWKVWVCDEDLEQR
jgi:hypothetical protein